MKQTDSFLLFWLNTNVISNYNFLGQGQTELGLIDILSVSDSHMISTLNETTN